EIYKINKVYRKYIRIRDANGQIRKIRIDKEPPTLAGVPETMREPPKGISNEEWARDTPSRYLLFGNPKTSLICYRPEKQIRCQTNDMRSCICSDGSIPIFKNG